MNFSSKSYNTRNSLLIHGECFFRLGGEAFISKFAFIPIFEMRYLAIFTCFNPFPLFSIY